MEEGGIVDAELVLAAYPLGEGSVQEWKVFLLPLAALLSLSLAGSWSFNSGLVGLWK